MKKLTILILSLIILNLTQQLFAQTNNPLAITALNLRTVPTRTALEWLAKFAHANIVVSHAAQGEITLGLKNVSWQKAMDVILFSNGLFEKKVGNIIYIAPLSEIQSHEKQQRSIEAETPLHTKLLSLNYANAGNIVKLLKDKDRSLLSKSGSVSFDARTNSILVRDNQASINEIQHFIKKLDIPVPQVLIEARIVNIDSDYEKDLGFKFGTVNDQQNDSSSEKNTNGDLNTDLPSLSGKAGLFNLALFKIAKGTLLDLELSALESEGRAEIISNPKLLTANQQPAMIESGEEIPYQNTVAQGVTSTTFKNAVLRLKVTPQINPDNKIILHLELNQDKRGSKEFKGVPTIDTRKINTQVLINDNQTVVLGGIYEQTKTNGVQRIPFLGKLPLIGALFRHKKTINTRRELLVFVTPKIIKTSKAIKNQKHNPLKYKHKHHATSFKRK